LTGILEKESKQKIVIVIDALDQLDDIRTAHSMNWLPVSEQMASNVFFIVSASSNVLI
jgi:hypothetical protein